MSTQLGPKLLAPGPLDTAPEGLYILAGPDGLPLTRVGKGLFDIRDGTYDADKDVTLTLHARVRTNDTDLRRYRGAESVTIRPDGKIIVTQWIGGDSR